jgi:hypothetical protein
VSSGALAKYALQVGSASKGAVTSPAPPPRKARIPARLVEASPEPESPITA